MQNVKPLRLQRKRVKGFDMQAVSMAANGLPGVSVCRPGVFGNPFTLQNLPLIGVEPSIPNAIEMFRLWLATENESVWFKSELRDLRARLPELRGKNLFCFCAEGEPCHGDVLLETAACFWSIADGE